MEILHLFYMFVFLGFFFNHQVPVNLNPTVKVIQCLIAPQRAASEGRQGGERCA